MSACIGRAQIDGSMHPLGGQNRLVVANLRPKIKLMSNALVTINNSATTVLKIICSGSKS